MVVDDLRGGILGSSLFAGCNNDDPVTPDAQPEIVFAKESLDVPAEGGPFQIEYTIENPVANATLSAKCNDSWITDIDTKTAGVISFNVTKNETAEKREAIIEVSYADIQPAPSFTAKQAARPEEAFTITISDITTKTFRTTVRPGDQEMYYLLNIIPPGLPPISRRMTSSTNTTSTSIQTWTQRAAAGKAGHKNTSNRGLLQTG